MSNFTPGQRVTRNADNAHGTVRDTTPDGLVHVDMDHGTDVLGIPSAFRPIFTATHTLHGYPVEVLGYDYDGAGIKLAMYRTPNGPTEWYTDPQNLVVIGCTACDMASVEHAGFPCAHPVTHEDTEGAAELSETVEVTRSYGTTSRGIVTSRDQASDGRVIGYQVWVPGANRYIYADASNVRPLRDTRPAGQRRRPTQNELNER